MAKASGQLRLPDPVATAPAFDPTGERRLETEPWRGVRHRHCESCREQLPPSAIDPILHSRFHEVWSLRLGSWLGKGNDPRYTPTTTFETFPFPEGLSPNIPASEYADDPHAVAIADAARQLVELRDRWLNPPEWVEWIDEPVPGYPKRPVPVDEAAARQLKKRTLTNLYNTRPQWLADAHAALDAAVARAYGWKAVISEDSVLRDLLIMNQSVANRGSQL